MKDKNSVIMLNDESCSWCKKRNTCKRHEIISMTSTRDAVRNISNCTKARCRLTAQCDYYCKDNKEYLEYFLPESC